MKLKILIFKNTREVMKAERILEQNGFSVNIIPVPKSIKADCGMAIELLPSNNDSVLEVLSNHQITPEVHCVQGK